MKNIIKSLIRGVLIGSFLIASTSIPTFVGATNPNSGNETSSTAQTTNTNNSTNSNSSTDNTTNSTGSNTDSATTPTSSGSRVAGRVSYESFTSFPGLGRISSLCDLTQALWYLGFTVLLLSVFGMYVYGGYMYTTAGSNASKVNQAKEIFINSTIGLVIGLSVFLILNIINPDLLTAECEIEAIGAISGGPLVAPTGSGQVDQPGQSGGAPISGSRNCTEIDPSVWKFQGGKSMRGVDQRLHGVATAIFKECSKLGEFQISSTVRTCCGRSFHITGDALDWADGGPVIRDKPTGRCIERVAAECGIPQSRINPGVDANQRFHVHIDLGTRE